MSLLAWIASVSGLTSIGLLVAVAIMRLRMDGLKIEVMAADDLRKSIESALETNVENFADYRERAEEEKAILVEELERYEDEELDGIEAEPDRDIRIRRRRSWVVRVLSKAKNPPS